METSSETGRTMKRRGILAAAGAVVAGIVAKQAAEPVMAAASLQFADTTATASNDARGATILRAPANASPQFLLFLDASAASSNILPLEVFASGNSDGLQATSRGGHGVNAGTSAPPGAGFAGVFGACMFSGNYGVYGNGNGAGTGVFGSAGPGSGAGSGVYGTSTTGYGVLGYSTGGSASMSGISTSANIPAFAGGNSVAGGLAAVFSGTVFVNGMFVVADMTQKHGLLKHPDGSHRLMYTVEAPESWAEDFGTGTLVGGKAEITLDPDFAALIHTEAYHVFLTSHHEEGNALAVTARHADRFVVSEKGKGTSSGTFSYRIVAKPKSDKPVNRLAKFVVPNVPLPDVSKLPATPATAVPKKP